MKHNSGLKPSTSETGLTNMQLLCHIDHPWNSCAQLWQRTTIQNDLSTDWLGRTTDQIRSARRARDRRRCSREAHARNILETTSNHVRWIYIRHPTLEVHAAATRSESIARRDCIGVLYSHEPK